MTWWHYLLLVNFYLVLFFGFYALLLRKETFFQLNRIYLVAASLLSFAIPLIEADWVKNLFITQKVQQTIYSGPIAMAYKFTPVAQSSLTLGQVLNAVYIAVTLFLIIRLAWQLVILKKAIETPPPSAAYSFFKKISLGEKAAGSKIIADHEQVHAGQWHSVDVMIIETVMIINWFNPVVYLYRFAIKYIHEFIADREVIQAGTDKVDYALLLLSQTFEVESHSLVTPFYNHSLLKQRITMLQKSRSHRIALAKYGLSAPLFIMMMVFSSATVNNSKAIAVINKKTERVLAKSATEVVTDITDHAEIPAENKAGITTVSPDVLPANTGKIYAQVDRQPNFPGGLQGFGQFLSSNIHYPAADRANKISGRVLCTFVVETDGTLSDIKAVRSPSEAMGDEAVRVLTRSPRWEPGSQKGEAVRVSFTVPINFTLEDEPTALTPAGDKVFSQVEQQPQFPGGIKAFGNFLSNAIRYPKEDRENGVSGKALCTFIVEADGTLTNIKAIRSPSETIAKESVRVLSISPKWQPGYQNGQPVRVSYTVPLSYTLDEENTDEVKKDTTKRAKPANGGHPLYIVDGVELKIETDPSPNPLSLIPQDKIERMDILKEETATRLYGDRGKYGVIMITTKKEGKTLDSFAKIADKALYIVDGKETKINSSKDLLASVPQENIASLEVLKGATATAIYGEKGKNGVILVTTIKKTKP